MDLLDKEIKDIKEKLLPSKSTPEYNTLSLNLKSHLEKEEREQKTKKQKKYTRDIADYKTSSVFRWQSTDIARENNEFQNSDMEVSQPSTSEVKVLAFSQPAPSTLPSGRNDGAINRGGGPRTPNFQPRGHPPNRGKDKGPPGEGLRIKKIILRILALMTHLHMPIETIMTTLREILNSPLDGEGGDPST